MKRWMMFLAALLAMVMLTACATAEKETYTITAEEYELLSTYSRLEEVLSVIERSYLFEYDREELLVGAVQGMVGALGDPYAYYATPDNMEEEMESVTGEYGGLGIEVFANFTDNTITIRRVFYGSPAQQSGLMAGDKIIGVEGEDMTAYDLNDAVSVMRGEVGQEVTLTIRRDMDIFEVVCERAIVKTQTLEYEMLEEGVGYIRLHQFEGEATRQFGEAIDALKAQGAEALVLDLRSNLGGFVNLAVDIADYFLDGELVVTTEDKYGRKLPLYADKDAWDVPVAVLMNEATASASEILAGALVDHGIAKTVGDTSFGKGIVQSMMTLYPDMAGIQVTTDYWLTPSGTCIHEEGIHPDFEEPLAEDALDDNFDYIREKDNQLHRAVEVVKEMLKERQEEDAA